MLSDDIANEAADITVRACIRTGLVAFLAGCAFMFGLWAMSGGPAS